MAEQIEESHRSLEAKVDERTRELYRSPRLPDRDRRRSEGHQPLDHRTCSPSSSTLVETAAQLCRR